MWWVAVFSYLSWVLRILKVFSDFILRFLWNSNYYVLYQASPVRWLLKLWGISQPSSVDASLVAFPFGNDWCFKVYALTKHLDTIWCCLCPILNFLFFFRVPDRLDLDTLLASSGHSIGFISFFLYRHYLGTFEIPSGCLCLVLTLCNCFF